ncbi:uncharacterized protein DS421_14g458970 [Arachis hypogaea]|nr:uncharacterized protein DS421_14g458970 [Arachis hypogaea]
MSVSRLARRRQVARRQSQVAAYCGGENMPMRSAAEEEEERNAGIEIERRRRRVAAVAEAYEICSRGRG